MVYDPIKQTKPIYWLNCRAFHLLDPGPNDRPMKSSVKMSQWPENAIMVKQGFRDYETGEVTLLRLFFTGAINADRLATCKKAGWPLPGPDFERIVIGRSTTSHNTYVEGFNLITCHKFDLTDIQNTMTYVQYITAQVEKINNKIRDANDNP